MPKKFRHHPGPFILSANRIHKPNQSDQEYPFCLPIIQHFEQIEFHEKVTFFIGENGSGKSTLLEAIAVACGLNPEGGSRNFNFSTMDSHSILHEHLRIVKSLNFMRDSYFLRAESFYNVATEIVRLDLKKYYGDRSLHDCSHGESFMFLFESKFKENGLYFLDEPEAALSPKRQLQFIRRMHHLLQQGCQFVIATHSPLILAYPNAQIYEFSETGIHRVRYKETDHFLITRGFLNDTNSLMEELLADDSDPESNED